MNSKNTKSQKFSYKLPSNYNQKHLIYNFNKLKKMELLKVKKGLFLNICTSLNSTNTQIYSIFYQKISK